GDLDLLTLRGPLPRRHLQLRKQRHHELGRPLRVRHHDLLAVLLARLRRGRLHDRQLVLIQDHRKVSHCSSSSLTLSRGLNRTGVGRLSPLNRIPSHPLVVKTPKLTAVEDEFETLRRERDPVVRGRRATELLILYQQRSTEL